MVPKCSKVYPNLYKMRISNKLVEVLGQPRLDKPPYYDVQHLRRVSDYDLAQGDKNPYLRT